MRSVSKGKVVVYFLLILLFVSVVLVVTEQPKSNLEQKPLHPSPTPLLLPTAVPTLSVPGSVQAAKGEQGTVIKVVDGDTLTVMLNGKKETVRVIGINTPETVDPRRPVECFGKEASSRAKELLTNQQVSLERDPTQDNRDKYSRLLRYVWFNDAKTDYGAFMIENGYANEYTYEVPYKYQALYKSLQHKAEVSKKGLWADNACSTVKQIPIQSTLQQTQEDSMDKDCTDFKTHNEAQSYFASQGGNATNNVDNLDSDEDGIVCESLP